MMIASVAAMEHSEEMYTENYLSHDSPNYGSLKDRLASHSVVIMMKWGKTWPLPIMMPLKPPRLVQFGRTSTINFE